MTATQLDAELTDDEVADLIAFMKSLEGEFPERTLPRLPQLPSRSGVSVLQASTRAELSKHRCI